MNYAEFSEKYGITISSQQVPINPRMEKSDDMFNWACALKNDKGAMNLFYSMGKAYMRWNRRIIFDARITENDRKRLGFTNADILAKKRIPQAVLMARKTVWLEDLLRDHAEPVPPDAPRVLESLASDFSGIENTGTFEEWAGECGYSEDSRCAENTFRLIQRQRAEFIKAFGHGALSELSACDE